MHWIKRGKTWTYRFETAKINGKRKQIQKGGFRTKKEAQTACQKAYYEYVSTGAIRKPPEISVSDYYDEWLETYVRLNCKSTTYVSYAKIINNQIKPILGKYKLTLLSSAACQNLIYDLFNEGFSTNSLVTFKAILTGALDYAVFPLNYIVSNPAKNIRLPSPRATPSVPSRKKSRVEITPEQFYKIIKRFPEGHSCHLPFQIAYKTGLRLGEVFALKWDDIDFDDGNINVNQIQYIGTKLTFSLPKYDSTRIIPIDSELIKLLKRTQLQQEQFSKAYAQHYRNYYVNDKNELIEEETNKKVYMVHIRDNGSFISPRVLQHAFRIIHYEFGYKEIDFHSLRHSHAVMLDINGASELDIQERLGHKSLRTTRIYRHNNDLFREKTKKLLETIYVKKN